jgi:hypothetical protein
MYILSTDLSTNKARLFVLVLLFWPFSFLRLVVFGLLAFGSYKLLAFWLFRCTPNKQTTDRIGSDLIFSRTLLLPSSFLSLLLLLLLLSIVVAAAGGGLCGSCWCC